MGNFRRWAQYRTFYRQLTALAVPVALQSVLMSLMGIIDVFMVGQLGHQAIAAVGLSGRFHFLAIVIIASMASSCSVLMSQYWGSNNASQCRSVMALTLTVGLALLIPATLLVTGLASPILAAVVDDPQVVRLGADYLIWSAPVLVLTHVVIVYESGLRAMGQSLPPLIISICAVLVNVVCNYLFIGGHWGAPEMGVAGAALGTDIARLLQMLLLVGYLLAKHHHPLRLHLQDFGLAVWSGLFKPYGALLLPITLNMLLWSVGSLGYHLIASKMGTVPLAALSLIIPIEALYHALFMGFCSACAIMLGHRLGADDFAGAKKLAHFFVIVGPGLALIAGVLLLFAREPVLSLFGHLDQSTLKLANTLYVIMALSFWLKVLNFILIHSVLRAGGDNRFCLINDFICMWLLGLPITALAAFVFGASYPVVYALALVEEVAKGVIAYRRVRQGCWLQNLTRNNGTRNADFMSA